MLAFRLAWLRAGRLDCRIGYFGVTICGNIHGIRRIAAVTLAAASLFALRSAGRFGCNCPVAPAVALCRNGFTCLLYFTTNLAIGIAGVAFLSAGRLTATTNLGQRVVFRPVGFEGQVGEGEEHFSVPFRVMKLIRIGSIVANSSGDEPTGEVIAFASKVTFGKRVILAGLAVDDLYRIHRADAAVGIKSDGELFKLVVHRREINVLMRIESPAVDPLHLIIGSPAIQELIGVVFILGHCGFRVYLKPHIVTCFFLTGIVTFL